MNPDTSWTVGSALFDEAPFSRRFILTREWEPKLPTVNFASLNPSKADSRIDDMTVRKDIGFAKRWGYGRIVLTNLIPTIATDPRDLTAWSGAVDPVNQAHLFEQARAADLVVLAWGSVPSGLARYVGLNEHIVQLLQAVTREFHCIGITASGEPLHPSRAAYTSAPKVWAVAGGRPYLRTSRTSPAHPFALADRLRRVRVCCGDWQRIVGPAPTTCIGTTGVFLDPPYAVEERADVYGEESRDVAHAVREWAIANGDSPELRIALCGYEGEHEMPASWSVVAWKANGGFANQKREGTQGKVNAHRERIWFSPHCLPGQEGLFGMDNKGVEIC